MKRIATAASAVLMISLLAGTGLARGASQGQPPREETHVYMASRGNTGDITGHDTNLRDLVFSPSEGERFVSLSADDTHNNDELVALTVTQDIDADGTAEHTYSICGTNDKPLAIHGGAPIKVRVEVVGCDGTIGGTRGEVQMLFSPTKKQLSL